MLRNSREGNALPNNSCVRSLEAAYTPQSTVDRYFIFTMAAFREKELLRMEKNILVIVILMADT